MCSVIYESHGDTVQCALYLSLPCEIQSLMNVAMMKVGVGIVKDDGTILSNPRHTYITPPGTVIHHNQLHTPTTPFSN